MFFRVLLPWLVCSVSWIAENAPVCVDLIEEITSPKLPGVNGGGAQSFHKTSVFRGDRLCIDVCCAL